jgi:hypothetical protein
MPSEFPENLSPVAQAVRSAAGAECPPQCVAAVIRAVTDLTIPWIEIRPQENLESRRDAMAWGMTTQTQMTRQVLMNLAYDLEGQRLSLHL